MFHTPGNKVRGCFGHWIHFLDASDAPFTHSVDLEPGIQRAGEETVSQQNNCSYFSFNLLGRRKDNFYRRGYAKRFFLPVKNRVDDSEDRRIICFILQLRAARWCGA